MPDLRIDPITGLRAIVAGERGERPGAWAVSAARPAIDPEDDPFLEGHEERTPPELYALRPDGGRPDGPGWQVRVVPNLYPALATGAPSTVAAGDSGGTGSAAGDPGRAGAAAMGDPDAAAMGDPDAAAMGDPLTAGRGEPDLFAVRPANGAHEVIVNSPLAVDSLHDLGPEGLERAMGVWRERMREHRAAPCRHLIVNEGREAGASLPHSHAQLYALPFVPAQVARERERFTAYRDRTQGRNLLADLLQEEVKRGERVVAIDTEAVAICPFASGVPFQVQLIPRSPAARFEDDGPLGARLLHDVLGRLAATLGGLPPLNLWVRTAPLGAETFCWRIDLLPRLAQPAGLELGTDVQLNALSPETAAERLRTAQPAAPK